MTKIISWGQYSFRSNLFQPPGNSLRHIDVAYGYGYDGVELDVQLCRDDVLVLMHDNTLDRTTLGTGPVNQLSVEDLRQVRLKDPWGGPACYVETLTAALRRNGDRGPVMVDMHHVVPKTADALKRSVEAAGFDPGQLILLTYTEAGGLIYKNLFPDATVLLKARHDVVPSALTFDFVSEARQLDGILVPLANHSDAVLAFRTETRRLGLKLAVYMHDSDSHVLAGLFRMGVDYVTSTRPDTFGSVKNEFNVRDGGTPDAQ